MTRARWTLVSTLCACVLAFPACASGGPDVLEAAADETTVVALGERGFELDDALTCETVESDPPTVVCTGTTTGGLDVSSTIVDAGGSRDVENTQVTMSLVVGGEEIFAGSLSDLGDASDPKPAPAATEP